MAQADRAGSEAVRRALKQDAGLGAVKASKRHGKRSCSRGVQMWQELTRKVTKIELE